MELDQRLRPEDVQLAEVCGLKPQLENGHNNSFNVYLHQY